MIHQDSPSEVGTLTGISIHLESKSNSNNKRRTNKSLTSSSLSDKHSTSHRSHRHRRRSVASIRSGLQWPLLMVILLAFTAIHLYYSPAETRRQLRAIRSSRVTTIEDRTHQELVREGLIPGTPKYNTKFKHKLNRRLVRNSVPERNEHRDLLQQRVAPETRTLYTPHYAAHYDNEYSNLQSTSDIDTTIETRAAAASSNNDCSNLFIYLPGPFAYHGHGSQINRYIMSIVIATYHGRALLLVEPPLAQSKYESGSQFGCPSDAFQQQGTSSSGMSIWSERASLMNEGSTTAGDQSVRDDFPMGFSRLIKHPNWLSHGCSVPKTCSYGKKGVSGEEYGYGDWEQLLWNGLQEDNNFQEFTCTNEDGTQSNVVVTGSSQLAKYFRKHEATMMMKANKNKHQWALNLGATSQEADAFVSMQSRSEDQWDYILGLMNKAGFLTLQPWIARDVKQFLQTYDMPSLLRDKSSEYTAIHVRRGDKLEKEARREIEQYWRARGYTDMTQLPTDYIPFDHYLQQFNEECKGEQVMTHNVYIATDDPITVRQEIEALDDVKHINANTILWKGCHQLTFYFNPTHDSAFHLNGDGEHGFINKEEGEDDTCLARYQRNIVSVADMMILSKAKTFIGEYNSNWGRVIRALRVRLNDNDEGSSLAAGHTKTLDIRVAWGRRERRTPGY